MDYGRLAFFLTARTLLSIAGKFGHPHLTSSIRKGGAIRQRGRSGLHALFGLALIGLMGLLTGCPSKAPGFLNVEVHATNTNRCDDGIKVEVELDASAFSRAPEQNWVWVGPGQVGGLMWMDSAYDNKLPQGPITITAWCMRTGGQAPGKSVREFNLGDYVESRGVVNTTFVIRDMSNDPDTVSYPGYTEVMPPAPSIFEWHEWCELGVPGDCLDIE